MPIVEIPGVGNVEFPDSMRPEEIKSAAARLSAKGKKPAATSGDPFARPRAGYSGSPELPLEANLGLMDPLNWLPTGFGSRAAPLAVRALAGRARSAVTNDAAAPILQHAGTGAGVAIGGLLGGPGGAAVGGVLGRQVLSPRTIGQILSPTREIRGNTFPVKEALKQLGATWNKRKKAWLVPTKNAREARRLVEEGVPAPRQGFESAIESVLR